MVPTMGGPKADAEPTAAQVSQAHAGMNSSASNKLNSAESAPAQAQAVKSSEPITKDVTTAPVTAPLTKPVIPSIPSESSKGKQRSASVAFEIPLDELAGVRKTIANPAEPPVASSKLSLPKLHLSQKDLQEKLANTEARWKVRADLDRILGGG
eukprot:jgi/Hompol1/4112/HPOL_006997-RA